MTVRAENLHGPIETPGNMPGSEVVRPTTRFAGEVSQLRSPASVSRSARPERFAGRQTAGTEQVGSFAVSRGEMPRSRGKAALVVQGFGTPSHLAVPMEVNLKARTTLEAHTLRHDSSSRLLDPRAILNPANWGALTDFDVWKGQVEKVHNRATGIQQDTQERLVGVGWSHGGIALLGAAEKDPKLFEKVILVLSPGGEVKDIPDGVDVHNIWSWGDPIVHPWNKRIPGVGRMLNPDNPVLDDTPHVFSWTSGVEHTAPLRVDSGIHRIIARRTGYQRQPAYSKPNLQVA